MLTQCEVCFVPVEVVDGSSPALCAVHFRGQAGLIPRVWRRPSLRGAWRILLTVWNVVGELHFALIFGLGTAALFAVGAWVPGLMMAVLTAFIVWFRHFVVSGGMSRWRQQRRARRSQR